MERIVGHDAPPDQVPQRVQSLTRIAAACSVMYLREKGRTTPAKLFENCPLPLRKRPSILNIGCASLRQQRRELVREVKRDPAIAFAECVKVAPSHLTCRDQRIQITRRISRQARSQNSRLQQRRRQRRTLQ